MKLFALFAAAGGQVVFSGNDGFYAPFHVNILTAGGEVHIYGHMRFFDVEAATELGILVCHAPTESNCFGVAETTVAMMLSLLKKLNDRDADVREGKWRTADNFSYYVGARSSA